MISVSYSGNKRIFEGLLLAVMSLAKTTDEELNVYVLTMDLRDENPNFQPFSDEQIAILDKNGYTPYATLRLLLDLVPNMPDEMIYMDIDTMCVSDIKQLADVDISEYDFAATKDYMGRFWIHRNYCNSGVMKMNLKRIKEDKLFEKCRAKVNKTKMIMPDQTALNKYGKKKFLPFKFNEQRKIKSDTVVKHFCKGIVFFLPFGFHIYNIKQWNREKVHKSLKIFCFDDLYERVDVFKKECPECF